MLGLGELIRKHIQDVEVIYTRKTDVFLILHGRADISNKSTTDVFIPIHCNTEPRGTTAYGTETHTMDLHTSKHNLDVAKRENSAILVENGYQENYQEFDPKSPESYILFSLYQNASNDHSLKFA